MRRAQRAQLERGLVIGEAINAARLLTNEPGNVLTPRALVERAADLTNEPGVQAEILGPDRIEALGMGLLMGVARGSEEPPRLLCLTYTPPGGDAGPVLGLVGKGITFDTGGISIKPADGMDRMKDDMAGGAAVVAAVRAIARLGVPRRVVAVVPADREHARRERALKPGDVIRGASGLTVEINNTDAEGRLILGDGLWYARQRGATHLVDVATLTGACVVALGKVTTGLFGTPPAWIATVREAAARAGEPVWELPLGPEYREIAQERDRRHRQQRRPRRRRHHGGDVPEGVRRDDAVGAPRHRRHRLDRRREAVGAQGRLGRDGAHAGRARRRRPSVESWTCSPPAVPDAIPVTPVVRTGIQQPSPEVGMIDVALAAFGLTGVIMARGPGGGAAGRGRLRVVPQAARRDDDRGPRRQPQLPALVGTS